MAFSGEVIGWVSSVILLATLIKQVHKQWKDKDTSGVSKLLFVGQLAASVGFTVYSITTGNIVFLVTNAMLTINNVLGIILYFKYRNNDS